MANKYENKLPDPVSPMGLAASATGQGLMQFGEQFIKVTDRNAELEAEEIKRVALAEVDRMKTSFNQGMAIETMDLDKAKLEETKRGNLASEEANRIAEARLQQKTEADIAHQEGTLEVQRESLQDARDKWDDQMGLKERELKMQESRDRLAEDIAEKNWEQADKELAFQKEKFGWTKNIDELKLGQADKSLSENKRQFDANIKIRQQELAITEERLALDTTSAEDRKELDEKRIAIQGELKDLEGRRVTLEEEKAIQDKLYRKTMTELEQDKVALAERGMVIKEGMLTIAQGESERDKWVFHQVNVGEEVVQVEGADTPETVDDVYKTVDKYEFVAINVDEPELMDVRTWTEDGWSAGGAPDLNADLLEGIGRINHILKTTPSLSVDEAIGIAKSKMPDWDGWDQIGKMFYATRKTNPGYYGTETSDSGLITPDTNGTGNSTTNEPLVAPAWMSPGQQEAWLYMKSLESGGG